VALGVVRRLIRTSKAPGEGGDLALNACRCRGGVRATLLAPTYKSACDESIDLQSGL
jgi:hypothetical protein